MIIRIHPTESCDNCKFLGADKDGAPVCKRNKKLNPPSLCYYWKKIETDTDKGE